MSRIFLSHSSKDLFEAIAVRDWLAGEGWDDVFLDADPERGINPGERWERALHQAAQRCEAVVFLLSRNWLASGWCRKEYELARSLKKQLFGIVIDPTVAITEAAPELTGTWQVVSLVPGQDGRVFPVTLSGSHEERHVTLGADGLHRLKRGLEKAGLDPKFFAWPPEGEPTRAPYRGLQPLEAEDAGIFFGRDAPIVEALDRLRALAEAAPPRLLVILGASGAGKSSFLRAGLLPRLARDDTHFLPLPPIRPERAALTGETGLVHALETALPGRSRAEWRRLVADGAGALRPLLAGLAQAAFQRTLAEGQAGQPPAIVIAIDQAEELFRPAGAEEGAALLALLRDLAVGDDPAVIAIFAIRSDSYDALEHAKALEGLRQVPLALLPMPRGAYKEVIEGPARRRAEAGGGLALEPQLTQRLLEDIEKGGGSDALPLLAFTLEQLTLEYGGAGALRLADYEAFGGLRGAIDAAVERAFARADADPRIPRDRAEREALLRRGLVPWLAGIDPESKSPRRAIARMSDIPPEAAPLVELLVEERLLATDTRPETDPATREEVRIKTIEPAHEALLRQWGLLEGWLAEDFGLLATLEAVQRAARDWHANGSDDAWLAHRGQRLADAQGLDARPDIAAKLDPVDRGYLAACCAREEAARVEAEMRRGEKEAEETRKIVDAMALADANTRIAKRTRIGLLAALFLALVAALFASFAERQRIVARTAEDLAVAHADEAQRDLSGTLAALSQLALQQDPPRAVKLALASWPRDREDKQTPKLDVALTALYQATLQLRERRVYRGHTGSLSSATFSPDGTRVVTSSDDKTARLWDAATGKQIAVLSGHEDEVTYAVFSPDGTRVATTSEDNTARLWNAATGTLIAVLRGHEGGVNSATFSPNGSRLVTASWKTAQLWDATTGTLIAIFRGHEDRVNSAAFSPDGIRVVTASADKTARLWDVTTGTLIAVLRGHEGDVRSAAFSPDGIRVVTASGDKTARLWNATTGALIAVLRGHEGGVNSADFSPDGTSVVTASADKTARLWDVATSREIEAFRGHQDDVTSAAFSPDGARIVTASFDKTARLWDAATGTPIAILRGHEGTVYSAVFSPDGSHVVTASYDRTARLWDAEIGKPIFVLRAGHGRIVWSTAFSPDGTRVITASGDSTARLWDAATGKQITVLNGHADAVLDATFSPDGTRVATASWDGTARLWNAATGTLIAVLSGYEGVISSVSFSPDGARVVTTSNKTARLWDGTTGKPIAVLNGHEDEVRSAAFSPDGTRVITASDDKTARIWDAATAKLIVVLNGHEDAVLDAAFSPDSTRVVTASSDRTARLWNATTGKVINIMRGHEGVVKRAAFSPNGTRVVTTSDSTARLWDGATGTLITVLLGHENAVNSASFSPDGTRVVTASDDKTARIWDAATGSPITILRGHENSVFKAAFSPDGARVVTASGDSTARLWDVSSIRKGNLFQIACKWLPDTELTDIARDYGLTNLAPICRGDAPLPDHLPH